MGARDYRKLEEVYYTHSGFPVNGAFMARLALVEGLSEQNPSHE